ncbi:MAG: hypothetical protein HY892_18335, partial [Deltaproteobacteria bacterium]|nr:hypothetical protein [Deltaproteobacteria bacterium]
MAQGSLIEKGIIFFGILAFGLTSVQAEEKNVVAKIGQRIITAAEFEKLVSKKTG